jgi:hypothetical protein
MPAANVPLVIYQGEDWTSQVVWTDELDEPIPVVHPCRLDVKTQAGQTVLSLESVVEPEESVIPGIHLSTEIGLLQLHIPNAMSSALIPGNYHYDLFVTTNDGTFIGPQAVPLMYGPVSVSKRVTVLQAT